ncbi:MAG: SH3 domain-containing protein [Kiritimatiellia bacterium]
MRLPKMISAGILSLCCAGGLQAEQTLMSVQLKSADLRDKPSPFGSVAGSLAYGDRVLVLEQSGSWCHVKKAIDGDAAGWMHISALTPKHILLKAGTDASTKASSDEVAIAGKGFNPQVESQYRAANSKLDFAAIDRMEKIKIPLRDIQAFIEKGSLEPKGGAK